MHYDLTSPIFYADACLIFIVSGIICAVVRWFHMCRPYSQEADYYYPARKQITFYYAAIMLQLPYFLSPMSEAAWQYGASSASSSTPAASPCCSCATSIGNH